MFGKNKEVIYAKINVVAMPDTLPEFKSEESMTANLADDAIVFKDYMDKNTPDVRLPYDQIERVDKEGMTVSAVVKKSSLGRAVVGTVVAGPVGSVVGAVSGTGEKTRNTDYTCLVFTYRDGETGEPRKLPIGLHPGGTTGVKKFLTTLEEKCPGIVIDTKKKKRPKATTL